MRAASEQGVAGFSNLARALHDNRKIWRVFALEAASDTNPLPDTLRARLVSLAGFTQQHTSKVLARSGTVEPLLEINTAIMRGLRDGAG